MNNVRVIELKKSVYESNDREADKLREELKASGTFLINLMSSPGSGKTSSVLRIIEKLRDRYNIGIMEADIDGEVDAKTVADTGVAAVQLHTGGMCHLDVGMTREGLRSPEMKGKNLIILENVGNLVCPAEFDTGAVKNMMILSVPEGDDKPLKYPLMFSVCDLLLINKIDAIEFFDFDVEAVKKRVKALNPNIEVIEVSAKKDKGFDRTCAWIDEQIREWVNG
jgi:hydrogenase nickel incorporation protein HypB